MTNKLSKQTQANSCESSGRTKQIFSGKDSARCLRLPHEKPTIGIRSTGAEDVTPEGAAAEVGGEEEVPRIAGE